MPTPFAWKSSLLIALTLTVVPCAAQVREASVEFGILTCILATIPSTRDGPNPEDLDLVGHRRGIACQFRAGIDAPDETYTGTVQFVGLASRVFEKGAVILVAKAPLSTKPTPGLLQQRYAIAGVTEGSSQSQLVGAREASFVLHPLAQSYEQPTLAIGRPSSLIVMMELKLQSAPS